MNNYFITYVLVKSYYMESASSNTVENKTAIVEAESEKLAGATLKKYWEDRSDQYGESYTINDYEVALSLKQSEIIK